MITASELKNLAYFCANTNRWDLEEKGVIPKGSVGDTAWSRFNNDFDMFVIKLPADRLETLAGMINGDRQ